MKILWFLLGSTITTLILLYITHWIITSSIDVLFEEDVLFEDSKEKKDIGEKDDGNDTTTQV